MIRWFRSSFSVGLMASLLLSSCADDSAVSEASPQVELDSSQLAASGRLTVHFDPPLITGSVFFLRLSGGTVYWLSPGRAGGNASFGFADPSSIVVTVEAIRYESAVLSLPDIPDDESADLCFNEDFAFCVPLEVSQDGEMAVALPDGGESGLSEGLEKQGGNLGREGEPADEPGAAGAVLEMQERMRLGGLFGSELRDNFGSQLGVIGWSEDRSEFVVRGVGFTSDQVSRIKADAQRLGLDVPVRVVETALVTSDQRRLSDLIREQVLHALPPEVGWTIGIDLDSQRIDVGVDGYGDLAELDRAIRSVVEDFLKTLVLQRAATNAPTLDEINAGDLYYVGGAESALVDSDRN